jgi:hypothetical protein
MSPKFYALIVDYFAKLHQHVQIGSSICSASYRGPVAIPSGLLKFCKRWNSGALAKVGMPTSKMNLITEMHSHEMTCLSSLPHFLSLWGTV